MGLFNFGKKKEEQEPACACNAPVEETKEESCCCCGSNPVDAETENCCCNNVGDSLVSIKVLGAGCKSCHELYENTKKAVKNAGLSVEVEYITNLEKVMEYGVMSMPGLVVNEQVVSMGKVLKAADVEKLLHKLGGKIECIGKPKVAFVCVHNSCRSQIAEALGKKLASDVFESYSAGTDLKDHINQDAVRMMKKLHGIDMEQTQYSKLITDIPEPDVVIFMGCNVSCPNVSCQYAENWGLDDPSGQSDEVFEETIRKIEENIHCLKKRLAN